MAPVLGMLSLGCGGELADDHQQQSDSDSGGRMTMDSGFGTGGHENGSAGGTAAIDQGRCGDGPKALCRDHNDCMADEACLCRVELNESRCVPADCRDSSDCGSGACVETITGVGCPVSDYVVGFYCTSEKDSCDGSQPSMGGCGALQDCRFNLEVGAFSCHTFCGVE